MRRVLTKERRHAMLLLVSEQHSLPSAEHLREAASLWGLEQESQKIRQVENFVYLNRLKGTDVVLRLTSRAHRSLDELRSELDWMRDLDSRGLGVARPLSSLKNELVESLGDGAFAASVFVKLEGDSLHRPELYTDEMVREWGAYLGRFHRASQSYVPAPGIQARGSWDTDDIYLSALKSVEPHDDLPFRAFNELVEWLKQLKKSSDTFGLVHADLHPGNFFVREGRIYSFDFDDSCRHWFLYDLSAPLASVKIRLQDEAFKFSYDRFVQVFFEGYFTTGPLPRSWLERLDAFFVYRIVLLYHWSKTRMREGRFDDATMEWFRNTLEWWRNEMNRPLKLV